MAALEQFFTQTTHLPSMPEVARELTATFERDDFDLRDLTALISKDSALVAKVLRLANSARYSPSHSVMTMSDAAALLGTETLRNLALAACVAGAFPQVPGLERIGFWKYCVASASYAQWLARTVGVESEVAYLAGLMQRTGQLLMAQTLPGLIAEIEAEAQRPGLRQLLEANRLGCTHTTVTAELARRWQPAALKGFDKKSRHEALADIYESIDELKHYRATLFKL